MTLATITRLCADGLFKLHIEGVYPLQQTAGAHRVSAEVHVTGKLVIKVR